MNATWRWHLAAKPKGK